MVNSRDNLLVTIGSRAAYMDIQGCIDLPIELPSGVDGEEEIAKACVEIVDKWDHEENFDLYIEEELIKRFAPRYDYEIQPVEEDSK